jgi:hypothetical protein
MYLFNVTKYENLLIGIMMYVLADDGEDPIDIAGFISELYKGDSAKDVIQVYNIYQIITDLFCQNQDISGLDDMDGKTFY